MDSDSDDDNDGPLETTSDSLDLPECLRLQRAELEMLESMFPEELKLADEEAVVVFKSFVEALEDSVDIMNEELPPNLSFDIKLDLETNSEDVGTVELSFTLPLFYPFMKPTVMLRTGLNRTKQTRLRQSMDNFLASHPEGELYVANLVEFLREAVGEIKDDEGVIEEKNCEKCQEAKYVRMWIYSHHIYSMQKRKFIMEWSRELDLTGFSMPGKPGIVCVEGFESAVDEMWTRLRKLNWKRLAIKERETIWGGKGKKADAVDIDRGENGDTDENVKKDFPETNLKSVLDVKDEDYSDNFGRKFGEFEEISFDVKQGQGRNYHMDMGKFLDFLRNHRCERIFKLYFGVDGNSQ